MFRPCGPHVAYGQLAEIIFTERTSSRRSLDAEDDAAPVVPVVAVVPVVVVPVVVAPDGEYAGSSRPVTVTR